LELIQHGKTKSLDEAKERRRAEGIYIYVSPFFFIQVKISLKFELKNPKNDFIFLG
jgi:hypothetical protein